MIAMRDNVHAFYKKENWKRLAISVDVLLTL